MGAWPDIQTDRRPDGQAADSSILYFLPFGYGTLILELHVKKAKIVFASNQTQISDTPECATF